MQYKVFGLTVDSQLVLPQAEGSILHNELGVADVLIRYDNLSAESKVPIGSDNMLLKSEEQCYCYDVFSVGRFKITGGNRIDIHPCTDVPEGLQALYALGSCMGCIFQQRGIFAMHGSCICKNGKAILICGDSGAGKSTLASEFIKRGWKLLTDDVAVVKKENNTYRVVPSYPSQKLWRDSIEHYNFSENKLTSLMQKEREEKFHINILENFSQEECSLNVIVELTCMNSQVFVKEVLGFSKLQKVMDNVYLKRCLIDSKKDGDIMRFAIGIAQSVSMYQANRDNNRISTEILYEKITQLVLED